MYVIGGINKYPDGAGSLLERNPEERDSWETGSMTFALAAIAIAIAQGTIRDGIEWRPTVEQADSRSYVGVDLRATNTPVRQALVILGRQVQGERFDVQREIQGNINAWFINLPYGKAMDRVLSQAAAVHTTLSAAKPDPKRPNAPLPTTRKVILSPTTADKVTIDVRDTDIRTALRAVFRQTGSSYTVAADLQGEITITTAAEPLNTALARALTPIRGAFIVEGGVYMCTSTVNAVTPATLERRPFSFSATKERRQDALSRFARQAHITLELEGNVNVGERVTLKSEGQSVAEVLRAILGPKHRFDLRESGALVVSPGQPG